MTHHEIIRLAFGWWTAAGCKTYGAKPNEIAAKIGPYSELLSDVEPETLKAACQRCANTCKDFPSVADVREAVAALRDEQRAVPESKGKAHDDCALCDGTGWEDAGNGVTRCRCTRGLEFPRAQERKQIGAGEFRDMIAEAAKGRVM